MDQSFEEKKGVVRTMLDKLFGELDQPESPQQLDASAASDTPDTMELDGLDSVLAEVQEQNDPLAEPGTELPEETPEEHTEEPMDSSAELSQLVREAVQSHRPPARNKQYQPTVIGRDIRLEGDIYSEHDMVLDGLIEGNIECGGALTLRGRVAGNVYADKLVCAGAKIKGDISCKGTLVVDEDTVIAGDIDAGALDLNGKVDGGIKVRGHASVRSMAYVQGDLDVGGFNADKGSYINGHITIHGDESLRIVHEELSSLAAGGRRRSKPKRSIRLPDDAEPGTKL